MTTINHIATNTPNHLRQIRKIAPLDALRSVCEGTHSDLDLMVLYSAISKKISKTRSKDAFAWVSMAMAKNDVRLYLTYVYVTEADIVATDGHRLHLAPNSEGLSPGFYNKDRIKVSAGYTTFPDYSKVIPKCSGSELVPLDLTKHDEIIPDAKWALVRFGDTYVHDKYISQAIAGFPTGYRVYMPNATSSMLIKDDSGRLAVVMPCKQPKEKS